VVLPSSWIIVAFWIVAIVSDGRDAKRLGSGEPDAAEAARAQAEGSAKI
jgi:hypothetical protein